MSKKKEKILLTPDQEKFIKLHQKEWLREVDFEDQTFIHELRSNLATYLRHHPRCRKTITFGNGVRYRPAHNLQKYLISAAKKIRSSLKRYHQAFFEYENTGLLKLDPIIDGSFFELYKATTKAAKTLENINEIVHAMTYLDKEGYSFAMHSLMYKFGSQLQAIDTLRMRPAAEETLRKIEKDNKREKITRSLPEEYKAWLLERAKMLDTKEINRLSMFKLLENELSDKWPIARPFGYRCIQDYLLPLLPPRHNIRSKNKRRDLEDWG